MANFLLQGEFGMFSFGIFEEEEDGCHCDPADGEVDETGGCQFDSGRRGGRMTYKHHRQETWSVKAPPKIGPTTEEIPNMLDSAAM